MIQEITLNDIQSAHERIEQHIVKTPVMTSNTINRMTNADVYFKCENFQRVGAFKFRGAVNAVSQLSEEEKDRGVVTHSSGNHAQALSLAAAKLGVKATIVMPENAPKVKVEATRGYGASVVFCKSTVESRVETANALVDEYGFVLIHPYDDKRIIAGAGTAALELIEECGVLDAVFCPIGGGGLISGTSVAIKSLTESAKTIGAEPKQADDAYRSVRDGRIYPSIKPNTIADGLRTSLSELTFNIISENVDEIVLVTETKIVDAMRLLWERMKLVVEPSGAVPLAALLSKRNRFEKQRIGVILSGGNVDLSSFFANYYDRINS